MVGQMELEMAGKKVYVKALLKVDLLVKSLVMIVAAKLVEMLVDRTVVEMVAQMADQLDGKKVC